MIITIFFVLNLLFAFLLIDAIFAFILIYNFFYSRYRRKKIIFLNRYFKKIIYHDHVAINLKIFKKNRKIFFRFLKSIHNYFFLYHKKEKKFLRILKECKFDEHYAKDLFSFFKHKRIEAAINLGYIPTLISNIALTKALKKEKKWHIKLFIVNSLIDTCATNSILTIINTLPNSPDWYQKKINALLPELGEEFCKKIPEFIHRDEIGIQLAIINFAGVYAALYLKEHLLAKVESQNEHIAEAAAESLSKLYFDVLNDTKFLNHSNLKIAKTAVKALSNIPTKESVLKLIELFNNPNLTEEIIWSLLNLIKIDPNFLNLVVDNFCKQNNLEIKNKLARVLCSKIEYFLTKLVTNNTQDLDNLIKETLLYGEIISTIGFLNRNRNIELENAILIIIKEVIDKNPEYEKDFCTYLEPRIIMKLGKVQVCEMQIPSPKVQKKEFKKIVLLYILLIFVLLFFPLLNIYIHRYTSMSLLHHIKQYVLDFNYYLVYYCVIINSIYIFLLIFSFIGVKKQSMQWKVTNKRLLYKDRILPSISIIAPAYNEETTIIESANSLLNLKYPDYEVIFVNDGSKDETLNTLITYFNLERIYLNLDFKINTKPIRGIYANKTYPRLMVIDKINGGKADSLNVGINVSRMEFFCGIDADSLLETDSLIKLVNQNLFDDTQTIATGGNILPINGCSIDKGYITKYALPKNNLARFQTIEYLRAFMAGRVGWSYINSLLIISGAFGLFNKQAVIEASGYLTELGQYHKDTVGEDMELVVRVCRTQKEKRNKFKINYAYNANCWTEVPESYKTFFKQRDRWQRGLIDILIFHKKLLFNPKYGTVGLVAIPYYYIFEFLGPLIETEGYLMMVLASIFLLLNVKIALLLFVTTIVMGIMISLGSLLIAENLLTRFKPKDIFLLIFYAFIENFGFRQVTSTLRAISYFNSLKNSQKWGDMKRKGFH